MTDPTVEFFDRLTQRAHVPLLGKAAGTVHFEFARDHGTEDWFLRMDEGAVSITRSGGSAECTVRTDKTLFDRIVSGEVNAFAALLRGAMTVTGDPRLLVPVQRLFPGPPPVSRSRRAIGGK
jgi:putative sterol carrier protein